MDQYLSTLYDEGEYINPCYQSVKETHSVPVEALAGAPRWVCCNPIVKGGTRRQASLGALRNFVIEFDGMTVEEQQARLEELDVPYSTLVFSGNKSLHAVICLDQGVSLETYKQIAARIKHICPECDPACLEPSRLTRAPREGQPLLECRTRVGLVELWEWINSFPAPERRRGSESLHIRRGGCLLETSRRYLAGLSTAETAHSDMLVTCRNLLEMNYSPEDTVEHMANARQIYMVEPLDESRRKVDKMVTWTLENCFDATTN